MRRFLFTILFIILFSGMHPVHAAEPMDADAYGDWRLVISAGMGTSVQGLPVPGFTDYNGNWQNGYTLNSFEIPVQAGMEKIIGRTGAVYWGATGKIAAAYTFWDTQQGAGHPGNYFVVTGYTNFQKALHPKDAIQISGMWWAVTPGLALHVPLGPFFEFGVSAGLSLFGYAAMTIADLNCGYSTGLFDSANVSHTDFLQKYLPAISAAFDWSIELVLIPKERNNTISFLQAGMTGPVWHLSVGILFYLDQ